MSLIRIATLSLLVLVTACTSSGERPHRWLSGAQPDYPASARSDAVEGFVTVRYRIRADGGVDNLEIVEAQPPGVFEATALAAVRTWRYQPARRDGKPVAVPNVVSTLEFSFDDSAYSAY